MPLFILVSLGLSVATSKAFSFGDADDGDVIVHLFEWRWQDVAKECEAFLGPKGFRAVQVSPVNEHAIVRGRPWYERYQPVSYKIGNRSGSRADFINMVQRCNRVGVAIIVDTVINHMAGAFNNHVSQYGTLGTKWSEYNYPGLYKSWDFHSCNRHGDGRIRNYNDRWEVQNCRLADLIDLKTESAYVQGKVADFFNDLMNIGVAGFRVDASKHVPAGDIEAVFSRVRGNPYVYHEVLDYGSEPIRAEEYYGSGDVTEFRYGTEIARIFRGEKLKYLRNFGSRWGLKPSDRALVFIDNHDNQRGHGGGGNVITFKEPRLYTLANVYMLAWPYGNARVMSSYRFNQHDQGPPSEGDSIKPVWRGNRSECFRDWVCEHRWLAIANMVAFRKITRGQPVSHWWDNGNNQIAFGRGNKGFVVINKEEKYIEQQIQTGLPQGWYCNILSGDYIPEAPYCTNDAVYVNSRGEAMFRVKGMASVALHIGAKPSRVR